MRKPLLVGESNPYGSDPRYALYPEPEHSAGGRLCRKVMGLSVKDYIRAFDRVNLCQRNKWSVGEARAMADMLLGERGDDDVVVLLGARVAEAFGVDFKPFTVTRRFPVGVVYSSKLVVLPHPSGLSRAWNEPGAFDRARAVLTEAGVLPVPEATVRDRAEENGPAMYTVYRPAICDNCGETVEAKWCSECGPPVGLSEEGT